MEKIHNKIQTKKQRRYLRNNATTAERILWRELRGCKLGYKFRRQHSINNYILDFYCSKLRLIIELDGRVHNFIKQSEKDYLKEKNLEKMDYNIIRFTNKEVITNTSRVVNQIRNICKQLSQEHN